MKSSLSKTNTVVTRAPGLQESQASCVFQCFHLISIYRAPTMLTLRFHKLKYCLIAAECQALDQENAETWPGMENTTDIQEVAADILLRRLLHTAPVHAARVRSEAWL